MKYYTIETITFNGVWYLQREVVTVKSNSLEGALKEVVSKVTKVYPDAVSRLKYECRDNFGLSIRSNELIALVYNQILDENYKDIRIIRGWVGTKKEKKCFDILI